MFKKALSLMLVCVMLTSVLAVISAATSDSKSVLDVKWNAGYVGSRTNNNKNKVVSGSSDWLYSDVITLEKAGTKISFTTKKPPSNAVSVFSSWKLSGSEWVFDDTGVTIMATASYPWLGQTKSADGSMTYEYISDKDNENIRICTKATDPQPVVYIEATTEKSTRTQLAERDFTATLDADGKINGIEWMCGYQASASNTNGSAKEVKLFSASDANSYAVSNLILIPNKGTEISYTIQSSVNSAYNAFTRYKESGGVYVYEIGFEANDSLVQSGSTFTYVTERDNEIIRLCCRPNVTYTTVDIDPPVTVTWKQTQKTGTAAEAASKITTWQEPELLSPLTGAPLVGTEIEVKWNRGYVGGQYHASKAFAIAASSGSTYSYSDVLTIEKAGTTIYFFDQSFTDYNGGMYATVSAMVLSHWKKAGSTWVIDKTRAYYNGCDCPSAELDGSHRMYYYTTTEDNENIRLCFLSATKYSGEDPIYPPVYITEPVEFSVSVPAELSRTLSDGSYTDASGKKIDFKYHLPYTSDDGKQYPLIFDLSNDGGAASYFASLATGRAIVVSFKGEFDDALRLLDEVVKNLPVRTSDILYVGGDELVAHANKFSKFRFCQALLYTGGSGLVRNDTYEAKQLAEFSSSADAYEWLLGECEQYYRALEGLTMYALGDSYFGGSSIGQHLTWVNLLGNKYNMTYHNYGIGGNTVAECSGRSNNSPPMATRYTELPDGGDIYLIEGGRNDRHYSVPFGSNESTSIRTYTGALNTIISNIRKKNPDALIVLITPWTHKRETGYLGTNDDYADKMKALAEYYQTEKNDKKVVCLYAADEEFTGINMSSAKCRVKYCISSSDVSHLNPDGMNMIEPIFEKWIAEQYMLLNDIEPAPEDTDPPPVETTAPETSAPADEVSTDAPAEKKGCGSAVVNMTVVAVAMLGAAVVFKRK